MGTARKLANEEGNEKKSVMNRAPRKAMSVYKQIAIRAGYRYILFVVCGCKFILPS